MGSRSLEHSLTPSRGTSPSYYRIPLHVLHGVLLQIIFHILLIFELSYQCRKSGCGRSEKMLRKQVALCLHLGIIYECLCMGKFLSWHNGCFSCPFGRTDLSGAQQVKQRCKYLVKTKQNKIVNPLP